jgi:hypothetical protein
MEDRLKADETAIASQNADLTHLQAALQASDTHVQSLASMLTAVASALGLLVAILIVIRLWPKPRRRPSAGAPAPARPGPTPPQAAAATAEHAVEPLG